MKIEEEVAGVFEASGIGSVLVAVSGGADSVALLHICKHLARMLNLRVEAVNCNFHLRGEESDRDSEFVADLCRNHEITLHCLDYDVAGYMKEHQGTSTEMACRELRYNDFFRICEERGIDRVAVAHNADDDIETMLLNQLRGSGTRGLRGMETDNGHVIRPLLGVFRSEIEQYLKEIGQDFITDSSNLSSHYRRNFIRRDVIPMLEKRWPGARKTLSRTLSIIKEESEIVEEHFRNILSRLSPDDFTLLVYADGITTGVIHRFIEPYGGNPSIAESIKGSLDKDFVERKWKLSERYFAILERDRLVITDSDEPQEDPTLIWEEIEITPETMKRIKTNSSHDIIYLPHESSAYELRRPRRGDRMAPLGMKGTRLVSDIISDARLDHKSKGALRVLTRRSDGEIIWLPGLKRSRHDLVDPESDLAYSATFSGRSTVPEHHLTYKNKP